MYSVVQLLGANMKIMMTLQFFHTQFNNSYSYALMQKSGGSTVINSADGTEISLRVHNSEYAQVNSDGLTVIGTVTTSNIKSSSGTITVESDIDASASTLNIDTVTASGAVNLFGNTCIGNSKQTWENVAIFSHKEYQDGEKSFALLQNPPYVDDNGHTLGGDTILNSHTDGNIYLKINNSTYAVVTKSGLTVTGSVSSSDSVSCVGLTSTADIDASGSTLKIDTVTAEGTASVFGKASIGSTHTSYDDFAVFSHKDYQNNSNSYALLQKSSSDGGETVLNAASGSNVYLRSINNTYAMVTTSGLTVTGSVSSSDIYHVLV